MSHTAMADTLVLSSLCIFWSPPFKLFKLNDSDGLAYVHGNVFDCDFHLVAPPEPVAPGLQLQAVGLQQPVQFREHSVVE